MKILLTILLLTCISAAQSIEALLDSYERASELSNKTKDENAGNLILYTRSDLDRMQANTLKDLIKSMPFYHYAQSRLGQPDMMNNDPLSYYSHSVRIYLDENELLDPIAGSGFLLFGNMELDFIDHVEIYQGFPSFDFGTEVAMLVIHLYSKTAEHDNGASLNFQYGSNGSNRESLYGAQQYDDFSVFSYISRNDEKNDDMPHDNEILRSDLRTERLFVSLSTDNHRVQLHAMQLEGDAFMSSLIGSIPKSAKQKNHFLDISLRSYFQDKSLTFTLSALRSITDFSFAYNEPAYVPNTDPVSSVIFPVVPVDSLQQQFSESSISAGIKKEFHFNSHDISAGVKFRYKYFDLTDLTMTSPLGIERNPVEQVYSSENVYSIFLQDLYSINLNHLLSASIMYQHYDRDGNVEDPDVMQVRLGYVFSKNAWMSKTFLMHQEFTSEPYMTVSPHYGNSALEPESYHGISEELSYKMDSSLSKLVVVYGTNKGLPYLNPETFTMQNAAGDVKAFLTSLEWNYFFRNDDKIELQAHRNHFTFPFSGTLNQTGAMARMLNTVKNFDVFNEFV